MEGVVRKGRAPEGGRGGAPDHFLRSGLLQLLSSQSILHFTIPTCLCFARAPPLLLPLTRARLSPTFLWDVDERAHTKNGFQQIRKIFDYTALSKVTKNLLVKDHARKEPFCVKTIESTCGTLPVQEEVEEEDEQKSL